MWFWVFRPMATQDDKPGSAPFGSGNLEYVNREYEILDESGRHLGILRTVVLRTEIGKPPKDRHFWASAHAIDTRRIPPPVPETS